MRFCFFFLSLTDSKCPLCIQISQIHRNKNKKTKLAHRLICSICYLSRFEFQRKSTRTGPEVRWTESQFRLPRDFSMQTQKCGSRNENHMRINSLLSRWSISRIRHQMYDIIKRRVVCWISDILYFRLEREIKSNHRMKMGYGVYHRSANASILQFLFVSTQSTQKKKKQKSVVVVNLYATLGILNHQSNCNSPTSQPNIVNACLLKALPCIQRMGQGAAS